MDLAYESYCRGRKRSQLYIYSSFSPGDYQSGITVKIPLMRLNSSTVATDRGLERSIKDQIALWLGLWKSKTIPDLNLADLTLKVILFCSTGPFSVWLLFLHLSVEPHHVPLYLCLCDGCRIFQCGKKVILQINFHFWEVKSRGSKYGEWASDDDAKTIGQKNKQIKNYLHGLLQMPSAFTLESSTNSFSLGNQTGNPVSLNTGRKNWWAESCSYSLPSISSSSLQKIQPNTA